MADDLALKEFIEFLSFPSISSEPEYKKDVIACFEWLKGKVEAIGFKTERWETSGHPVLFAQSEQVAGQPTLLIYNHYDVQPADPLDLWRSPPFEPKIIDDVIYARGAQDNKGQLFYVYEALRGIKEKEGTYPINLKWIIEGEEEMGSMGLSKIMDERKGALKADYLAIVDCGIPDKDTPAVSLGMRGLITLEIEVEGTTGDLHSGSHGNIAYNPLRALAELIGSIKDKNGKIQIPGFYDPIEPLTDQEKKSVSFDFDEKDYEKKFGTLPSGGEQEYQVLERNWLRPSFEINGMWGGYIGNGFKTVIPAKAYAKISCRLVRGQDPDKMADLVTKFLEKSPPKGIKIKVKRFEGGGPATLSSPDSPIIKAFADAFSKVFQKPCKFILEGASIPIVAQLERASGAETALVGVGLSTDQIHAPNEHFGLDRFKKGALVIAETLHNLRKK